MMLGSRISTLVKGYIPVDGAGGGVDKHLRIRHLSLPLAGLLICFSSSATFCPQPTLTHAGHRHQIFLSSQNGWQSDVSSEQQRDVLELGSTRLGAEAADVPGERDTKYCKGDECTPSSLCSTDLGRALIASSRRCMIEILRQEKLRFSVLVNLIFYTEVLHTTSTTLPAIRCPIFPSFPTKCYPRTDHLRSPSIAMNLRSF